LVSSRSTCDRKYVGAVIVRDNRLISTGYNGSLPGQPHCDDPPTFWRCAKCGEIVEEGLLTRDHNITYRHNISCTGHPAISQTGGHDLENGHCVRTVHAEVNAVVQAARLGISTEGATMYCNTLPCWLCFKVVVSAGITEIVYKDAYRISESKVIEVAKQLHNFRLRQYNPTEDD
jgi:dCMP deaminase